MIIHESYTYLKLVKITFIELLSMNLKEILLPGIHWVIKLLHGYMV